MNARERRETVKIRHDGSRVYMIAVRRERWNSDLKKDVSIAPEVWIYPPDDGYYAMQFTSRSGLTRFIKQLQSMADEVWPV